VWKESEKDGWKCHVSFVLDSSTNEIHQMVFSKIHQEFLGANPHVTEFLEEHPDEIHWDSLCEF